MVETCVFPVTDDGMCDTGDPEGHNLLRNSSSEGATTNNGTLSGRTIDKRFPAPPSWRCWRFFDVTTGISSSGRGGDLDCRVR